MLYNTLHCTIVSLWQCPRLYNTHAVVCKHDGAAERVVPKVHVAERPQHAGSLHLFLAPAAARPHATPALGPPRFLGSRTHRSGLQQVAMQTLQEKLTLKL